ncbi:tRNA uracil 4-sulfurtransferase ThiI [Mangrovibacillus cuniculi]|uniref:Probable tRNA sulfurtransferase n=1 Tax=Mangrovibacillus cuniculi TaxID=2593652 RepID=A0A7S8CC43_9BACI|nr:tRNA uracil 4-sulfurtransferase ThiI [Mangrovibacillus cuniculi]QPC47238.1 tRNA 4-thiouridine(8) synthase ThiI [Mangrovibacillus cuniculi]
MKIDRILIRYGELSTKGRNRNSFIKQLKKNCLLALKGLTVKIEADRDRMYVYTEQQEQDEVMERLTKIFGIHSFSPVIKVEKDLDSIKTIATQMVQEQKNKGLVTFKVNTKRSDKSFPLETNEVNRQIGGYVKGNVEGLEVALKQPDIELKLEIRDNGVYIMCETIEGMGGLPVGTSEKAMLMLSGGLDSPVAGFMTMKRGVEIEAVHFFSPPYTSERSKEKVIALAEKLAAFSGKVTLHIVPFTKIQEQIQQQVPENYTMTSTRRMMLKITDQIRERRGGLAIVNGESLGQVASQTLHSMMAINDVTATPIIRPVISMDKLEIISIAKTIDTHDISILPFEDCCTIFTPAAPKTRPKLEKVKYYESFLPFDEYIAEAVDSVETIEITKGYTAKQEEELMELL